MAFSNKVEDAPGHPLQGALASFAIKSGWPVGDMFVLASVLIFASGAGGVIWQRHDMPQ